MYYLELLREFVALFGQDNFQLNDLLDSNTTVKNFVKIQSCWLNTVFIKPVTGWLSFCVCSLHAHYLLWEMHVVKCSIFNEWNMLYNRHTSADKSYAYQQTFFLQTTFKKLTEIANKQSRMS